MKKLYTYILYIILSGEVVLFVVFFIRGPQGLHALSGMYTEHVTMREGVQQLNQEVASLKQDIENWQNHSFNKEKIAREQLQMAYPNDEVFYLT